MFKEHPYVACMPVVDCFGVALCLELVFRVVCSYLAGRACSFAFSMLMGVCANIGGCVKFYLGPTMSVGIHIERIHLGDVF